MICLDNQFDKIESTALYALTDVMNEFALEIASEMRHTSEGGHLRGRPYPNLIDALDASYDFGYDKKT